MLQDLGQSGSLRALFPRPDGAFLQSVLINTAGGVTGGDRFSTSITARPRTRLSITTQAAERIYRAATGETATIANRIQVGTQARVNWLPQETILFQGCALRRTLHVELAPDASLLMVEPLVFGRKLMGETLTDAAFRDRIEISRNGQPLYLDAMALHGDISARLARAHVAGGAGAMASLVYVGKDAGAALDPLRAMIGDTGGASLISDGVMVLRLLAPDGYLLRKTLIPVLDLLSNDPLPRCWMT